MNEAKDVQFKIIVDMIAGITFHKDAYDKNLIILSIMVEKEISVHANGSTYNFAL